MTVAAKITTWKYSILESHNVLETVATVMRNPNAALISTPVQPTCGLFHHVHQLIIPHSVIQVYKQPAKDEDDSSLVPVILWEGNLVLPLL